MKISLEGLGMGVKGRKEKSIILKVDASGAGVVEILEDFI
jgi:hypothetical protein